MAVVGGSVSAVAVVEDTVVGGRADVGVGGREVEVVDDVLAPAVDGATVDALVGPSSSPHAGAARRTSAGTTSRLQPLPDPRSLTTGTSRSTSRLGDLP
ncbi:MAG: hypothetical protein M5U14_03585 [Acidimicrobiia bacterium]|nr:hypothetical protein [Acidimicrobiia bacterium]